jgi:hypothetical protein
VEIGIHTKRKEKQKSAHHVQEGTKEPRETTKRLTCVFRDGNGKLSNFQVVIKRVEAVIRREICFTI